MAQPYVGEIRLFAGNFAPAGWELCNGQILPIEDNEILFNLIGTTYGGDGQETFGLPDLQGRIALHWGNGPGGSYQLAQAAGTEQETLTVQQMPSHTHPFAASTAPGSASGPQNTVLASAPSVTMFLLDAVDTALPANLVQPMGGSQPHANLMPTLALNYIISMFGIYPSPS